MRVALTPPALKRDRFCTVVSVTDTGDGDLVSFEGIDDLTAAEGITGCYVLANRDDFELDSLDAAYTDLMGREVVDERFGSLGTIVEIVAPGFCLPLGFQLITVPSVTESFSW